MRDDKVIGDIPIQSVCFFDIYWRNAHAHRPSLYIAIILTPLIIKTSKLAVKVIV